MATEQAEPLSDVVDLGGGPRRWVLISGGLMAFGWLTLVVSILTTSANGILLGLFLMVPVNIWWRVKTRRDRAAADPERAAAEKQAKRSAKRQTNVAILKWGARTAAGQAKSALKANPMREGQLEDERVRLERSGLSNSPTGTARLREIDAELDQMASPRLRPPSDITRGLMVDSGNRWMSIIKGFFTPMRAAVAEWRAAH